MDKRKEIAIHIGFWLILFGMTVYLGLLTERDFTSLWDILQLGSFSLIQIIIFYLNYSWICKRTIPQKKWLLFIAGQIFLLLLFPTLRHIAEEVVIFKITGKHNYHIDSLLTIYYVYDNSYYAIRIILYSLVFFFLKDTWVTNQKMNDLVLQKKQAELQNLKSQLSPHFLFNTLNSFYADVMDTQPKIAEDILKLSDMLRYVTYENEEDQVYLKDEIKFIGNYIQLFSRRFDGNIHVNFKVENTIGMERIPSLLLIHFVENALKHGISSEAEQPITIQLAIRNNSLFFKVENHYIASENYDKTGIGYKNIRQRLNLLFPKSHVVNLNQTDDFYGVELQIPLF